MNSVQWFVRPFTSRKRSLCLFSCLTLAIASSAMGQADRNPRQLNPKPEAAASTEGQAKLVVRVYAVDDLLIIPNDYPLPTALSLGGGEPRLTPGGMGGGMGMGGVGGGMGGGMFSVPDQNAAPAILRQFGGGGGPANQHPSGTTAAAAGREPNQVQQRMRQVVALIGLIKTYVNGGWAPGEPEGEGEWSESGQCTVFGGNLIVRQTEEVQRQVAELLKALRSGNSSVRSITVDATWLVLDSSQRDSLQTTAAESAHGAAGATALNTKLFRELAAQSTAFRGRIVCLNGQKVHLTTGARRVVSRNATPTVGVGAAAYSVLMGVVNVGAVLQVTPSISGDRHSAFVDVQSAITHWGKPGEPIKVTGQSFAGSSDKSAGGPLKLELVTIDRPNVGTQEWSTTASIPLDVPVLIGSATLTDPNDDAEKLVGGARRELSLVVEVHAN